MNEVPPKEKTEEQPEAQNNPQFKEKTLLEWTAPERPFKSRTREFWVSVGAIASIVSLILFLIEGSMSVILIIALVFLFYILSTVEPRNIKYEITNYSIKIAGKPNYLEIFTRYWFVNRSGSEVLVLETVGLPGRLELVINPIDKDKITKILDEYIIREESTPDSVEKAIDWLSKKIPGNN